MDESSIRSFEYIICNDPDLTSPRWTFKHPHPSIHPPSLRILYNDLIRTRPTAPQLVRIQRGIAIHDGGVVEIGTKPERTLGAIHGQQVARGARDVVVGEAEAELVLFAPEAAVEGVAEGNGGVDDDLARLRREAVRTDNGAAGTGAGER